MNKQAIVCVDDETTVLKSLKAELKEAFGDRYLIEMADDGQDALDLVAELLSDRCEIPLVISDYIMPGIKGDELLLQVHRLSPYTLKIMLTGQATLEAMVNAVHNANLYRYIPKPWQTEDLRLTVTEALNSYHQTQELIRTKQELVQANREQAQLIAELHENERRLKQFTDELFQVNQAFSQFVPRQFMQLLDRASIVDVQLGDQIEREMSVLFADIRGFTAMSEAMSPEDTFQFINAFFRRMEPAIVNNGGFIDKYIGDAVMALFSSTPNDAVQAGVAMLERLQDYNQSRLVRGQAAISMGIGINTGSLMLGTVGGQHRMDTTVISDTVNVAARLEKLTKEYGVSLLITEHTLAQLYNPNDYAIRLIAQVAVRGKSQSLRIYEVFDADPAASRHQKQLTKAQFEQALALYQQQNYQLAMPLFQACLTEHASDRAAQIYLQQCQTAIRSSFNQWRASQTR
ncbi:adenylate/guanylate cyclase domain-containing protein [Almyronema epifaneia]|uniref:Adenylate/guanylate cyclase domain-containing protein n=1 Tax=Almyronema epifaneia S1 TaxID=2991925 RepID=A0ABW6IAS3_9CYAN